MDVLATLKQKMSGRINALSFDDISGEKIPVNLPGTDREYKNWRRKYRTPINILPDLVGNTLRSNQTDENA